MTMPLSEMGTIENRVARPRTHPGALLREDLIPASGLTVKGAARRLGVSRGTLHRVLAEEGPVTPSIALRLARLFGGSADMWIGMQSAYDLQRTADTIADDLDEIEPLEAA